MEGWKGEGDKEDRRGDEDVQASDMNEQKELKLEIAWQFYAEESSVKSNKVIQESKVEYFRSLCLNFKEK